MTVLALLLGVAIMAVLVVGVLAIAHIIYVIGVAISESIKAIGGKL